MNENKDDVLRDLTQRLSLRAPQKESLERFAAAVEAAGLKKGADAETLAGQLAAVRALYPNAGFAPEGKAFDWDFLSFCFALATGVGKTRLMGAIIAYLYRVKGIRNFLVIAPGKTVYEKLIADFTEGTPKYVFKGLACFAAQPPVIVTGDNYQYGSGMEGGLVEHSIAINVFNIQKLNERGKESNGGKKGELHDKALQDVPKIRRLRETMGQSYFDYLKSRKDLVVLMDEAHHYRANEAGATVRELEPVLGIEMTATPRIAPGRGRTGRFSDVLFEYGLADAMKDGFVKEPAVVRRQNFRSDEWAGREDELDRQKLTDAIVVHETTKAALEEYAFKNGVEAVKPFVLVVAPDTTEAAKVEAYLKSASFYGGKYAGKTITVTSANKEEKKEEAVAALLAIEKTGNPVEIVIHVNMLTEGWDVTNLYTIVPLRAANSANLVEQTIGRGLRLPYGKRTGVAEIDTLSIVSHDKFDAIIEAARNLGITMKRNEVPAKQKRTVVGVPTVLTTASGNGAAEGCGAAVRDGAAEGNLGATAQTALKVIEAIVRQDMTPAGLNLDKPEVKQDIEAKVSQVLADKGTETTQEAVTQGVAEALRLVGESMIAIPHVVVAPGETTMRVEPFGLDVGKISYALRDDKLVYDYVTDRRVKAVQGQEVVQAMTEEGLREFIRQLVGLVAAFGDVDYDGNRELVGKLCEECVRFLAAKLEAEEMSNCMRNNLRQLAEGIRGQIREHTVFDSAEDKVTVRPGPFILKPNPLAIDADEQPRPYDVPVRAGERSRIRSMVFTGFRKCLFSLQKFDSEPERAFATMLERETSVQKWFKPTLSNLTLYYGSNEYTPDFVVETDAARLLCEVKATGEVDDAVVQLKKNAAVKWCSHANEAESAGGTAKPWKYLLVPDNAINGSLTLAQAVADFG